MGNWIVSEKNRLFTEKVQVVIQGMQIGYADFNGISSDYAMI